MCCRFCDIIFTQLYREVEFEIMRNRGTNQEDIQISNRALILKSLQHVKNCSRVELSKITGLKQATVGNIINDFIKLGLIEETGSFFGNKGRRTIGVSFSDKKYRVIGFRLTRRYYTIGIFTLDCKEICEYVHVDIKNLQPEIILEEVCNYINSIISENNKFKFLAVGVSVPGPYYKDSGEIALISAFPGWKNIKIRDVMQSRINIPVIVEHDANAGVLAESTLLSEWDMYDTMVYISAGQGIGAGIINNGELYTGTLGIAGEIGHTCIDVNGSICECGRRGCLDIYASTIALTREIRKKMRREDIEFSDVVQMLKDGSPEALEVFNKIMLYMGTGIINLIYTYNPKCIVIGDEMSSIGKPVLDSLSSQIQKMSISRLASQVKIELAKLGDSAYIGAAVVATHYVFNNISVE